MAIVGFVWFASFYLLKSSEALTVSLSVTPPSPVVGQEVTLTCTASQDITTDTAVFYKRNTLLVGRLFVNSTSCSSGMTQGGQHYTFTCGSLPVRQMSITIPADYVTEKEHGADWRCEIFLGAASNPVQLTVSVPVSTVTITTDRVYRPSVTISAGNTRTFTCTTTASRPVARLSWFRGDNNITDQAGTATGQDMGDDKYTRQQSLTITGRVNDVDSGLKCEAVNIEGRTPVSSQTTNVIIQWEPQTDPILTRDPPTTTLSEGVAVALTCQQNGGRPLATLTWSGVCSGTTPTESSDTTTVTSSVQLSVTRTYNGQMCACESRHPVNSYMRSLSETFVVLFGPDAVTVTGNQQIVADGMRHLTLTCLTAPYHQYVTLTWKRGTTLLTGASSPSNTSTADGTVTSQDLTLTPDRTWDGDTISCTAETIGTTIQRTGSVQLDLLYLPETDVLVGGYDQNTQLTETSIVSMYCTVRGGKPVPTLTFTCPGINVTPTLGEDGAKHYSNITFTAVRQLNGQQCSCTGIQSNNQWMSIGKSHALNVLFGPDTVTVTGNQQIVADGVSHLTLTCLTAPYHQYVTLTWKRGNTQLTGASSPSNTSSANGTVTSQFLTLTPDRTWDGDTISCTAETIGTTIQRTDSVRLDLLYIPETNVSVGGYDQNAQLTETSMVSMYCTVRGGKPVPTLTFTCSGIMNTPKITENGGNHFSNITFTTVRQLNGRQCSCTGTQSSTLWTSNGQSKTFNVMFGPDGVYFSGINGQLTENSYVDVKCSSNESNPVPMYKWTNGSAGINLTSQVVESDGQYNGKITSQIWSRNLSRYDDGVVITCTVSSPDRRRNVSTTASLSVLYQPYISVASSPQSPVIAGRQLTLTCDVDSNPDSNGTWSRPVSQPLPGTTQTNGVLVITSVSRHDNGTYRCTATNSQKTNMLDIDITVHYPPDQMTITYNNITYDDDKATRYLRCSPDGNPRSFTFLKWQHLSVYGQLIRELDGVTSGQKSVLTIRDPGLDTRYQDTGYYVCRVENGVPDMNGQLIFSRREFFNVNAPPVYGLKTSVFPGQKETSINISIPFYSTSRLGMMELSRNQSVVSDRFVLNTVPTNVSLTFHGTNITVGGFTTEISVQTLQQEDFGNYTLNVTNDVGYQQFEFYLKAAGPPDAPSDLQITETSVNSVRVEWTAGFDGGSKQHFIVEYATDMSEWNKLPIIPQIKAIESVTIRNLREETYYMIRVHAANSLGFSDFVFINTSSNARETPVPQAPQAFGPIIGGAVGGVAILILVPVVLIILYKRRMTTKKDEAFEMGNGSSPLTGNEVGEGSQDGLKQNILYESAGPRGYDEDGLKNNILYESAGPSYKAESSVYAEVNKKGKGKQKLRIEPNNEYAVVDKQKDSSKNDVYAEVVKPKGKQGKGKGKGKGKKPGKTQNKAAKGMVYENMDDINNAGAEENDNVYANADCKQKTDEPKSSRWKNKDGLDYIDVVFEKKPGEGKGAFVIHGLENRTDYAEVDFCKHAEPLPIEDETEEPKQDEAKRND